MAKEDLKMDYAKIMQGLEPAVEIPTAKRGRPTGAKQVTKKEAKALSAEEKFQLLKQQLIKDLKAEDYDPRLLRDIIEHRDREITQSHHRQGGKLWAKLLLQRGKIREDKKLNKELTIFDGIKCFKFADGLQFELPQGMSFKEKKISRVIEIIDEVQATANWNKIMM